MKALIVINFKTYKRAQGKSGVELARKIARAKRNGYDIIIAPSMPSIGLISSKCSLPVFAQKADCIKQGPSTGHVCLDELKGLGVKGAILNHSENKMSFSDLKEIVQASKQKRFKNIVCVSSLFELKRVAALAPTYIAFEPKELIGGTISVTQAKPDLIVKAVEVVREISPKTKLLCGAGIHSKEDVGQALVLGCEGVLLSHAIVEAKDPRRVLEGMLL